MQDLNPLPSILGSRLKDVKNKNRGYKYNFY